MPSNAGSSAAGADPALYLPISRRALAPILGDIETFENAIAALTVPQVAALIVLQHLPEIVERRSLSPDRILIDVITGGSLQASRDGLATFRADALRVLDRGKIREGYRLLPDFGIALLDDAVIEQRAGEPDPGRQQAARNSLSVS